MSPSAEKQTPNKYVGNLLIPIIILACAAVLFSQSLDFPPQEDVGAEVIPHLWIFFIILFCVYLIVATVRRKVRPDPVPGHIGHVFLFITWLTIYLFAAEHIGYFISTFVFMAVSMYSLTYRRHVVIFSVSMGWTVFSYVIFYRLLYIQLPMNNLLKPLFEY